MRILRVRGRFRQAWRLVIFCSNAGCSMFAPPCQEYSHAYIPYGSIHTQIVFLLKHAVVLESEIMPLCCFSVLEA